jgi:hypothetical protein
VVGLATHAGGYLLKSSATTEPLGLVADLLSALGYAVDWGHRGRSTDGEVAVVHHAEWWVRS